MYPTSNFLTATPPTHRKRRRAAPPTPTPTPPVALTLVAAAYDPGVSVTLTFDRAIDIAAFDGSQVYVYDGPAGLVTYYGTGGAALVSPESVQVGLVAGGEAPIAGIALNASAATGIVAADDGGAWPGVALLPVPFP